MAAPQKTVAALEAAVAAVKEAKVPKDLRVAAFNAAFYGSNSTPAESPQTPARAPASSPPMEDESDQIGTIAQKLEMDSSSVGLVYDVDEDGVHLTMKRDILSSINKVAQQEVTYLVVAARQAIGLEEWTSTKTVLEATHDRGVHDTNVSKAITALDGDGFRFRGPKSKREMKINAVGLSKAAAIVKRLTETP